MHCSYPCTVLHAVLTYIEDRYMHRSYQYTVLTHAPFLPMLRTTLMTCKEEEASVMELVVIVL